MLIIKEWALYWLVVFKLYRVPRACHPTCSLIKNYTVFLPEDDVFSIQLYMIIFVSNLLCQAYFDW